MTSDFEQEFNRVEAVVTDLFKEFSWWSDNQKELYDVSDLHKDAAGYARLGELESHLAMLTRPGSLLWSSGDDSAYDAYPSDLQNPTYVFEQSGIYVDGEDDWETDGYTDEERGEPGEEVYQIWKRPKSPDYDIRLRYAYTLNCLSQLAEQYFSRLDALRSVLKPQFDSGRVTIYRALALTEKQRPERRRQTIFPLSMRMSGSLTRYWENPEIREKYTYESYGKHWSLIPGFEWSDDFPSYSGGRAVTIEKQIPYTEVDWFNTLLVMAYGREPEFEVAVNENVFLAENEVKIPLYHVTPLTQVANILTTGLEPRIGPRSELMELEPRVYLFGERESMQDSFIWEEMTDDKYGDEWLSGYAVLRIDLPAEWFEERRVVKTFDPDGPEPSWEWSTGELIPPEYIEVEEEWEWAEDDISRYFRADFEMRKSTNPLYRKYLREARNQAELDLETISDDYKYFHLSWDHFVIDEDGETFTFTPRIPMYPYGYETGTFEDDFTPRVSLSSSIMGCLDALPDDYDGTWYVYGTKQAKDIIFVQDYFDSCPDGYGRDFNMLTWISSLSREEQDEIKNHLYPNVDWDWDDDTYLEWGEQMITPADLPPKYRDLFYACVPDALQHDEYWSLEPITMDYLGYITWDTISHWYEVGGPGYPAKILRNAMRNPDYWLSESVDAEEAISYPLRLYHGTSVRNWRAIQASGELRTGCLASSHGYDIDMPDTYIDLAIGEIEDGHPDIKAGGVVLEITFPDQATADQYLEADTTMYDLGMAVLEYDLYHRYAPTDWQPEDAQEGWHYGSWDWFETDFQDLIQANQATKTVPYYPQDLSDWQASYLSVYSVCIKQPIPLEYITVTWGSESRRAETEQVETVGEAWSKAIREWNQLTKPLLDQVKERRDIEQITKKDYQLALDIYKIISKYSGLMFSDIGMWPEELPGLIPSITDDLESRKLLERQSLDLFDIEGKMNYYFYYALLSWVRGMNMGVTGQPGSPIGDYKLNEIILSQFQSPTVKAYRWISTAKDVQPFRRLSRQKYVLSYGDHWSLHPEAYKLTGEWEGYRSSQDYLIEKDVPVEDIDWFATLISCLSWYYSPEFEIIMKQTTYIAETVDEPHLYLDMDGCFADFAGAITRRVNEVLQVQDVSEIPSKSLRRAVRRAHNLGIYSATRDDFDLMLVHEPERKRVLDRMLYKIASEPGFFYTLDVMNQDVLDEIVASGRPFSFLSAPISEYSEADKRAWVRDRLGLDVDVIVVPREQKVDYCQPGDILLDDHAGTIAEWREAGGVGIWFPHESI